METDKFEQHIKTKLNEREITPSKEAWSKISGELSVNKTSRKSSYFWMGIAASFLVIIGTTLFLLNTNMDEGTDEIKVVAVPVEKVLENSTTEKPKGIQVDENNAVVLESVSEKQKYMLAPDEAVVTTTEEKDFITLKRDVAIVDSAPKELKDTVSPILVSDAILNLKIAEVIAQVDALELNNNVTDAEVDSLLQKAQQDILREKLFNTDHSVNAMALLTEVEEELDQSFRDQIFESLKTGFLKVRTAVADRNN